MTPCDHRSVGILVYREGKLLLIDRKRPPYGLAAPAGHVDNHGNPADTEEEQFRSAAFVELQEEVGLTAGSLELLVEGRKDNSCRREGGTWHYWRIYRAETAGEVRISEDEVRNHLWCSREGLQNLLADQPLKLDGREVTLEPVWREWLSELLP